MRASSSSTSMTSAATTDDSAAPATIERRSFEDLHDRPCESAAGDFSMSVERDFQDLQRVGAAFDARQLTLGEDDEIAALHQRQLEQAREDRVIQLLACSALPARRRPPDTRHDKA